MNNNKLITEDNYLDLIEDCPDELSKEDIELLDRDDCFEDYESIEDEQVDLWIDMKKEEDL